jgi:hypothetical protein
METAPAKITKANIPGLAVGLFRESRCAHGAIADLERAGLRGDRIAIAFSAAGKKAHKEDPSKGHWGAQIAPASEYSVPWKLRRWFEQDLHHRTVEHDSGEEKTLSTRRKEDYSEVDLRDTLKVLGVAEDRILLLDQILGVNGVLVLVDAAERLREAEVILEKNAGQIRTDSATECPPVGFKPH